MSDNKLGLKESIILTVVLFFGIHVYSWQLGTFYDIQFRAQSSGIISSMWYKLVLWLVTMPYEHLFIGIFFLLMFGATLRKTISSLIGILKDLIFHTVLPVLRKWGIGLMERHDASKVKTKDDGMNISKVKQKQFMRGYKAFKYINRWNKGLRIGNIALRIIDCFTNIIFGASGSGKSKSILLGSCLTMEGSIIITDPASEMWQCSGYLASQGVKCQRFAPLEPQHSACFNPIAVARQFADGAEQLARIVITQKYGGDSGSDNAYFQAGGKRILKAVLECCINLYESQPELATMHNAYEMLNLLMYKRLETATYILAHVSERTAVEFKGALGGNKKGVNDKISTAQEAMEFFSNPVVAQLTCKHDISFQEMREQRVFLCFQIKEGTELERYSPLLNIFYSFLFNSVLSLPEKEAKNKLPINIIIEEAGAMGKIENIHVFVNQCRKYNSSLTLVAQDPYNQFTSIYGNKDGKILLNSVNNSIILNGMEGENVTLIKKKLGRIEVGKKREWLMEDEDISGLKHGEFLIINKRKKPVLVKQKEAKDYRSLRKKLDMGAIAPSKSEANTPVYITEKQLSDFAQQKKTQADEYQRERCTTPEMGRSNHINVTALIQQQETTEREC